MTALLDEAAAATAQNQRIAETYSVLKQNQNDRLVHLCWDSYCVRVESSADHWNSRILYSGKIHASSYCRMEAVDSEGRPVFSLDLCISCSPKGCDESCAAYQLMLDNQAGQNGGFAALLNGGGIPGYCLVHDFDRGRKLVSYPTPI